MSSSSDDSFRSSPAQYPKHLSYKKAVNKIIEDKKKKLERQVKVDTSSQRSARSVSQAPGDFLRVFKLKDGGMISVTKDWAGVTYVLDFADGSKAVLEKHKDHMSLVVENSKGVIVRTLGIEF